MNSIYYLPFDSNSVVCCEIYGYKAQLFFRYHLANLKGRELKMMSKLAET